MEESEDCRGRWCSGQTSIGGGSGKVQAQTAKVGLVGTHRDRN